MARITVEDCLEKIDSQYDLVLLAKERTAQLNAGDQPLLPEDNDKNTVIALREIAEGKVSIKTLEDSAIDKLRIQQEDTTVLDDLEDEEEDHRGPPDGTLKLKDGVSLDFEDVSAYRFRIWLVDEEKGLISDVDVKGGTGEA